jgi:hypothetical protein
MVAAGSNTRNRAAGEAAETVGFKPFAFRGGKIIGGHKFLLREKSPTVYSLHSISKQTRRQVGRGSARAGYGATSRTRRQVGRGSVRAARPLNAK